MRKSTKGKHRATKTALLKAIRAFCAWCCTDTCHTMLTCDDDECLFFPCRLHYPPNKPSLKARISEKCHECEVPEPAGCAFDGKLNKHCPLFPYRTMKRRGVNYLI